MVFMDCGYLCFLTNQSHMIAKSTSGHLVSLALNLQRCIHHVITLMVRTERDMYIERPTERSPHFAPLQELKFSLRFLVNLPLRLHSLVNGVQTCPTFWSEPCNEIRPSDLLPQHFCRTSGSQTQEAWTRWQSTWNTPSIQQHPSTSHSSACNEHPL